MGFATMKLFDLALVVARLTMFALIRLETYLAWSALEKLEPALRVAWGFSMSVVPKLAAKTRRPARRWIVSSTKECL